MNSDKRFRTNCLTDSIRRYKLEITLINLNLRKTLQNTPKSVNMENKENYCNNPLRRLKSKQNYSKKNFLGNQRQKPEYERVMSSRLIR